MTGSLKRAPERISGPRSIRMHPLHAAIRQGLVRMRAQAALDEALRLEREAAEVQLTSRPILHGVSIG